MRYPDKWLTKRRIMSCLFDLIGYLLIGCLVLSICLLMYEAGRTSSNKIKVTIPAVNTIIINKELIKT